MSGAFDFAAALARLERIGRVLEDGERLPSERRALLEARALRWARPPAATGSTDAGHPLVVFRAGGQRCGVEPARIREVLKSCAPTPLPGLRPYISGVVHHRGQVLAVLDLGAMAGVVEAAPEAGGSKPAPVVVVDVDGHVFGIRVDSVPELDSLLDDDGPAAAGAALALPGVIRRCASGALMCLDLAALARDPRVTVDEGPG